MIFRISLVALLITVSTQQPQNPNQDEGRCRTIQVHPGDSCGSLAKRCGISGHDFEKYNPDPHLCSTLQTQQHVCCSPGGLPDLKPKPNPDGSCATYSATHGDNCAAIGAAHGLTVTEINSMNHHTWGWEGCINLQAEQTFCLSHGAPPMPAPIKGTICGPQVPGTKPPKDMSNLADLNPCPLKACCNKWGQCGTTAEFCIKTNSSTGNPGTSAPHTNGCISNCGMQIVNNGEPPAVSRSVGYFEAWNMGRPCLNMDASQIDASQYDVVHFSFAEITPGFEVKITDKEQFEEFKKQHGFKKVVSFGGWSFSTSQDSYPIFRNAVTDSNRATFAKNVASFVRTNNLDGVDFDWEYPGAIDIPNIPPGDKGDGERYLAFLKTMKSMLDKSKTLSIAAPASYWYLKGFPIAEISKIVDYIVYMTYDLHGQWDYENKYAAEGCPHGSCLRSHVNYTETINALSMITKAGVPASKIVVGIASYGRSFQMKDPDCSGPDCTFTGPKSGAHPGICTETAGYISNAEINDIINKDKKAKTHYDQTSDSVILRYGDKNWVSFMDDNTRKSRISSYKAKNFGGIVDWAMDLGRFHSPTHGHQGGHGPDLNINSTCKDLESEYNYEASSLCANGISRISRHPWCDF
ncbi:glycoside hydrolase superfamily [Leptodontidium sp. MPI-SDFR-AT-0119]|nr:glycoside hydrolase superfamily [Leptodontidium sp. MPI-SDFR-AT-0119]